MVKSRRYKILVSSIDINLLEIKLIIDTQKAFNNDLLYFWYNNPLDCYQIVLLQKESVNLLNTIPLFNKIDFFNETLNFIWILLYRKIAQYFLKECI